jgi:hypothetical protein
MAHGQQDARHRDDATQPDGPDPRALLEVLAQLETEFEQLFAEWRARRP